MLCKQKEAKVHLSQIVGDKMQKFDLCEDCAKAKGVNDPVGFSLADLLQNLGATHESEAAADGAELKCPQCGFTQADFKKAGRLGCAHCYVTFGQPLEGLLKSMHKGARHVGKVPQALRESRDFSEKLKTLQKRLEQAIAVEDFELAASLRDEIKQFKGRSADLATS
jgi:protein arginine kinase activator